MAAPGHGSGKGKKMTRKRYIKLMMGRGYSRQEAEFAAILIYTFERGMRDWQKLRIEVNGAEYLAAGYAFWWMWEFEPTVETAAVKAAHPRYIRQTGSRRMVNGR